MTCKEISDNTWSYVDGSMQPALRQEYDDHMASCRHCQKQAGHVKYMEAGLSDLKQVPVSPFASARIQHRLDTYFAGEKRGWLEKPKFIFRPVLILFAVGIGILFGRLVSGSGHQITNTGETQTQEVQSLRSEFYISDFLDEEKSIITKP
jgi:anti-sigma factor RsiW